jgi:hypothetical protein
LALLFGKENLVDREMELPEGMGTEEVTVLFPNVPSKKAQIDWVDAKKVHPRTLTVDSSSSAWRTLEGVTIGTSLKELERINDGAFEVYGFGFDGAGAVGSWRGGRLQKSFSEGAERKIFVRMVLRNGGIRADENAVMRGQAYLSSLPVLQRLDPVVGEMSVEFNPSTIERSK